MPIVGTLHDFVPNTTILSADVESDFAAIRTVVNTNSLLNDVARTITVTNDWNAAQDFHAGSVGAPGIYLNGDADTGIYQIGANNLGVAAAGAKVLDIATAGLAVTGTLSATGAVTASSTLAVTGAATLSSTLAVTGAVTAASTLAVTGIATFSADIIAAHIRRNTVDGADTGILTLSGSVGALEDRGAFLTVAGNEHAMFPGYAVVSAGTGGKIALSTAATVRVEITNAGAINMTGATTISAALAVTATTTTRALAVEADSTYDIGTNGVRYANIYGDAVYGTLGTAAQPNITSVGTLTSLDVTGALSAGSLTFSGALTAASLNLGGATVLDILTATVAWDPASVASGASDSTNVTVTGAAVGDVVMVSQRGLEVDYNGMVHGYVSAADTVTIVFSNYDAGAVDLTNKTYRVVVLKF